MYKHKKEGINVLSLFDGMSGGQIGLNKSGIRYKNYFSSEIDKHAIEATQNYYPDTKQLGDIKNWESWDLDFSEIDLLCAGFPCQSWSIAGNMGGATDTRGKLMFVMMDILNHIRTLNPNVLFLFENVNMKKVFKEYVNEVIGTDSIFINSALLSSQNRNRQYWTNIPNVEVPKNLDINLADILEDGISGIDVDFDNNGEFLLYANNGKAIRLNNKVKTPYTIYEARTEFGKQERKRIRKLYGRDTTPRSKEHKEYLPLNSGKANCLLTSLNSLDYVLDNNLKFRTYTINELCMLQTIPIDYFDNSKISDRQIRKIIGNGWTIDVIAHIFSHI
jgi:DNA (cytosine-5)-methyltransferase 3A